MRRLPKNRRPTPPGEVFLEDFLLPRSALRLAKFSNTEPEFWLNLQQAVDLWDAMHSDQAAEIEEIQPAAIV